MVSGYTDLRRRRLMRGLEHVRAHSPLSDTFLLASVFASLGLEKKTTVRLPSIDTYTRHAFAVTFRYVT